MFYFKSIRFASPLLFISLSCFLVSCTDEELEKEPETGIPVASDIYITQIEEKFNETGSLFVQAGFGNGPTDSIADYGFVFTDGLNDEEGVDIYKSPQKDVDHTVSSNNLVFSESRNQYIFDALINPERFSSLGGSNHAVVNIMAYITTLAGDTYFTETEWIAAP
jgi:hypothetical protein